MFDSRLNATRDGLEPLDKVYNDTLNHLKNTQEEVVELKRKIEALESENACLATVITQQAKQLGEILARGPALDGH